MAYDREEIIMQALQVIEQENCTNVSEVLLYLPISRATFYGWGLDKLETISTKIDQQKVRIKAKMKKKWFDSDNPALAIAAFKLIAQEDEADALNTSKVKNEHKIDQLPKVTFEVVNGSQKQSNETLPG